MEAEELRLVRNKALGRCAHCGKLLDEGGFVVSKVVPVSAGGGYDMRNLVPLCKACSRLRGRGSFVIRDFYPWLDSRFVYDAEFYAFGLHRYLQILGSKCTDSLVQGLQEAFSKSGQTVLQAELNAVLGYFRSNGYMDAKRYAVYMKAGGVCAHCGEPLNAGTLTLEHVVPKSWGGSNGVANLLPLCVDCNHLRGNSAVDAGSFYPYLFSNVREDLAKYLASLGYKDMQVFLPLSQLKEIREAEEGDKAIMQGGCNDIFEDAVSFSDNVGITFEDMAEFGYNVSAVEGPESNMEAEFSGGRGEPVVEGFESNKDAGFFDDMEGAEFCLLHSGDYKHPILRASKGRCAHCGMKLKKLGLSWREHSLLPELFSGSGYPILAYALPLKVALCESCIGKYTARVVLNLPLEFPYLSKDFQLYAWNVMGQLIEAKCKGKKGDK